MSKQLIDISIASTARAELVTVRGRVDSSSADEVGQLLRTILEKQRYNIILELSGVDYMSSAGLRVLISTLRTCKANGGKVCLVAVLDRVDQVLDLAGIKPLFCLFDDMASAIAAF